MFLGDDEKEEEIEFLFMDQGIRWIFVKFLIDQENLRLEDENKDKKEKEQVGGKRKIACEMCNSEAVFQAKGHDLYYCSKECLEKDWN